MSLHKDGEELIGITKKLLLRFLRRLARALGVSAVQSQIDDLNARINEIENQQAAVVQLLQNKVHQIFSHIDVITLERGDAIQRALVATLTESINLIHSEIRNVQSRVDEINQETDNNVSELRRSINRIQVSLSEEREAPESRNSIGRPVPVIDEFLYVALEDAFRGDSVTIEMRQSEYLPYVEQCVNAEFPLLDIGFGRGEWLELLASRKISARGIDNNAVSVAEARSKGLNVQCVDIADYLISVPDQSIGAVTMFQVAEHLSFEVLIDAMRQIRRVLRPGGVLIVEVPNSETLSVGASTFWIDPTHQRPLFPGVLTFLAKQTGYTRSDGLYTSPLAPEPDLNDAPEQLRSVVLDLYHRVYGPGDFALIAWA